VLLSLEYLKGTTSLDFYDGIPVKKLLIACGMMFFSAALHAGLTIAPSRQDIVVPSSGTFQGVYSVRNDYDCPVRIAVDFRDWFVLPENKHIAISEWLSVSPRDFQLQPGESKEVGFSVHVPSSAQGLLVGMVSFIPQLEKETGVNLVVSAALFVTVGGTEKYEWDVSGLRLENRSGKLQASATVTNRGNVHLRPVGNISLLFKNKEALSLIFTEGRPVYPGGSRTIVAHGKDGETLAPGAYEAVVKLRSGEQQKEIKAKYKVKKSGEIIPR